MRKAIGAALAVVVVLGLVGLVGLAAGAATRSTDEPAAGDGGGPRWVIALVCLAVVLAVRYGWRRLRRRGGRGGAR